MDWGRKRSGGSSTQYLHGEVLKDDGEVARCTSADVLDILAHLEVARDADDWDYSPAEKLLSLAPPRRPDPLGTPSCHPPARSAQRAA